MIKKNLKTTRQTYKVEAYRVHREFGAKTCKPKLPFPFEPRTLLLYMSAA